MSNNQQSDFNMLKVLGVIPSYFEDQDKSVRVRCPLHEDGEASLKIDFENEKNVNANNYSSSYCYVCNNKESNINISKYWLEYFTEHSAEDSTNWWLAHRMFKDIKLSYFKDYPNMENKKISVLPGVTQSFDYETIKQTVLTIFDEETLYEHNQNWESELKFLVNQKELFVEKHDVASPWCLTFNVSFGNDYNFGSLRYQPHMPALKAMLFPGTPTGQIIPFSIREVEGKHNSDHRFNSNIIANPDKNIFIVEGPKDALALRLIGIHAITLTGGAKAQAAHPQLFLDKNVYIIYDNDKAGHQGARKLALQLVEYANVVKVATGVYQDLKDKEDAFDFFFVYKKSKKEFAERLKNDDNYALITKEILRKEELEKEAARKEEATLRHISALKKRGDEHTIKFNDLFSLEPHRIARVDAKLDETKTESKHSIYLRPILEIRDSRAFEDMIKFPIEDYYASLQEGVEKVNTYIKNNRGTDIYNVLWEKKEDGTTNSFKIERLIDENDFDIIEAIILGGVGEESFAYTKAGAWKEIQKLIESFSRNINRKHKKGLSEDSEASSAPLCGTTADSPIKIIKKTFNKKYVMDFTDVKIYEDKTHEELSEEHAGSYTALYSVLIPSHLIKPDSKIGDKVTVYGGKMKRLKDNKPYLVAWYMDYRDPIDDFELTPEIRNTLDKFMFKGNTLEELTRHQELMYELVRTHNPVKAFSKKMWETLELTFTSPARLTQVFKNGESDELKSAISTLIAGDSQIGKSESMKSFRKLYGVGRQISFRDTTVKALTGGSDTARQNAITLGLLPLNHRGLVNLDELSAIQAADSRVDFFQQIMDIMQNGEANISRVSGDVKAKADTRLVITSNTVSRGQQNPPMATYKASSYWKAVEQLIPALPLLNRFTIKYLPSKDEFNFDTNNETGHYSYKRIMDRVTEQGLIPFTAAEYRAKISWIWSRKPEDVIITEDNIDYAAKRIAEELKDTYDMGEGGIDIGIYTSGNANRHILMIAAAAAASLISTDSEYKQILVKNEHIDYAIQFFDEMYSDESGIKKYIAKLKNSSLLGEEDVDTIFGDGRTMSKFYRNNVITLSDKNDITIRATMYSLYEQLYSFMTSGGNGDGSINIAWNHMSTYFDLIMSRWNEMIMNPGDPGAKNFPAIGNEITLRNSKGLMSEWKIMMGQLGIIQEKASYSQTFVLQPKFTELWNEIKIKYEEMYDMRSHEKKIGE